MGDERDREDHLTLGRILSRLDNIETRQGEIHTENRADHANIFEQLTTIRGGGCAIGRANAEAIRDLKSRPERTISIAAAIAAILAFLGSVFLGIGK
jgi:hypothetical protein